MGTSALRIRFKGQVYGLRSEVKSFVFGVYGLQFRAQTLRSST